MLAIGVIMMNRDNAISLLSGWCIKHDDCEACVLRLLDCDPKVEWDEEDNESLMRAINFIVDAISGDDSTSTHVGAVDHPKHYQGKNECIDVMRAMFGDEAVRGFCKCNAYKYRFRAEHKNGSEDIRKAEWYESYLIGMDKEDKGNG